MKSFYQFRFILLTAYLLVALGCSRREFIKPTLSVIDDGYAKAEKTDKTARASYFEIAKNLSADGDIDEEMKMLELELKELEYREVPLLRKKKLTLEKMPAETKTTPAEQMRARKRMVYHDGEIKTRSTEPEQLLDSAVNLAKAYKGYLESRHENTIVIRIPVEHFRAVFDSLLNFGEIIDYSRSSTDITEAFYDTEARISILQKTIKRLREILTHTKKEEEQIKLLNQIKRLSEELEGMITRRKVLSKKARYSRIVFAVLQHTPSEYHPEFIRIVSFSWIRELNPFAERHIFGAQPFKLDVPEGMVKVKKPRLWFVQSAGGSKLWTAKIKNNPEGTSEFWMEAIRHRIKNDYYGDTTYTCGDFKVLQMKPFPGEHYVYAIAVQTINKDLYIAEMYFPDAQQYERFSSKVISVLERKKL